MTVTQGQIEEFLATPEVKVMIDSLASKIKALIFDLNSFSDIVQNHDLLDKIPKEFYLFNFKEFAEENSELLNSEHFYKAFFESYPELLGAEKADCYIDAAELAHEVKSFPVTMDKVDNTLHEFHNPLEIFLFKIQECDAKFINIVTSIDKDIAQYVTEQTQAIGVLPYQTDS